jgi:hypothetical protein
MGRHKGELSRNVIDRDWPHQIAIEARLCTGDQYMTKHFFCAELSLCSHGHSFYRDGKDYNVYCFTVRDHAEAFRQRFGGDFIDPTRRARWVRKNGSG